MLPKVSIACPFLVAVFVVVAIPLAAAEVKIQEGVVVSAGLGKLVMTDVEGKQHSHMVDEMTKIMVNGKPAKLEELKLGMRIQVMLDEKLKVLSISTVDEVKAPSLAQFAAAW